MTLSLQEISDRMEIQDLFVAYTYALDTKDWAAFERVFTPDAFIDYSVMGGSAGDLPSTIEFLRSAMPMFPSYQHMVATSQITVDGDTAEAKTICHNPMTMGEGDDADLMVCGLWYLDKLVRTADGWRIKERVEEKSYMRIFPGKKS